MKYNAIPQGRMHCLRKGAMKWHREGGVTIFAKRVFSKILGNDDVKVVCVMKGTDPCVRLGHV